MSADSLRVAGPYTDQSYSVLSNAPDGKVVCHGMYRSKGLAEQRLFELRDQRSGVRT